MGWGLCQIGMAFFFQAFLSNARSATSIILINKVIGYIISLWTTLLAVSLNFTIFDLPRRVPSWLLLYPTFNISRILYYLTSKCGYESCISDISTMDSELKLCLVLLFVTPWIYMILGMYLYEVLPQQYGVRKHPLFFLRFCKKKKNKKAVRSNSDAENNDSSNLQSDDDINNERKNRFFIVCLKRNVA